MGARIEQQYIDVGEMKRTVHKQSMDVNDALEDFKDGIKN